MRWWSLTRNEARERARAHIKDAGLPWTEPIRVSRRPLGGWEVMTHADHLGGNVLLSISRDGRISGGNNVTPR